MRACEREWERARPHTHRNRMYTKHANGWHIRSLCDNNTIQSYATDWFLRCLPLCSRRFSGFSFCSVSFYLFSFDLFVLCRVERLVDCATVSICSLSSYSNAAYGSVDSHIRVRTYIVEFCHCYTSTSTSCEEIQITFRFQVECHYEHACDSIAKVFFTSFSVNDTRALRRENLEAVMNISVIHPGEQIILLENL